MPRVVRLFRVPKSGWPMEELAQVSAIQEMGFEGCAHARPGKRQLLLVDRETLDALEFFARNDSREHHDGRTEW
jgi:hypothetical protein